MQPPMIRRSASALVAVVLLGSPICFSGVRAEGDPDAAALHGRLKAASVEILVDGRLMGSGWLASENGFAFTASHVVPKRKATVVVRLGDGRLVPAQVRARDAGHDALLLALDDSRNLPAGLPLASGLPAVGEEVFLFGAPIFRHGLFLAGRVAREGTTFEWLGDMREGTECVHVEASTPKGVSGGPWVNRRGEVVGVQSGIIEQDSAPAGIGWFGPASALSTLLAAKQDSVVPTLGVAFEELEEQSVETIRKFPAGAKGIILKVIVKGGPAEAAKLPGGCLAVALGDGHPTTRDAAYRFVRGLKVGQRITVRYRTPGGTEESEAEVTVGDWKEFP